MPISWLDVILIVIMLISGFLAMVRGFTREVLSIFSWAVGARAPRERTPQKGDPREPPINKQKGGHKMLEVAIALIVLLALDLYTASVTKSRGR